MKGSVDAILMASGASSRFVGENKLFTLFRGKPLMMHTVDLTAGCGLFRNVYVVYAAEKAELLLRDAPVVSIRNTCPERGICESIRLGTAASKADFYLFLPCDQPLLDRATLELILAARKEGRITVPYFQGRPGNPVLFSRTFRDELLALKDGEGGRIVRNRHPDAMIAVELSTPEPLEDIDTFEDLRRLTSF